MNKTITVRIEGHTYRVEVGDLRERPVRATVNGRTYLVEVPEEAGPGADHQPPSAAGAPSHPDQETGAGAITAPIPGQIVEIRVKPGDPVGPGDVVCVLEAMKMKNLIYAPRSGVIAVVDVSTGQQVAYGDVLVTYG